MPGPATHPTTLCDGMGCCTCVCAAAVAAATAPAIVGAAASAAVAASWYCMVHDSCCWCFCDPRLKAHPRFDCLHAQWLHRNGAQLTGVDFPVAGDDSQGLLAATDADPESTLLQVPPALMLTAQSCVQHPNATVAGAFQRIKAIGERDEVGSPRALFERGGVKMRRGVGAV